MRRREVIAWLGCAAFEWPFEALGKQLRTIRRIGMLWLAPPTDPRVAHFTAVFKKRLQDLGWNEQINIEFMMAYTGIGPNKFSEPIGTLLRSEIDVLVTSGTPAIQAAQKATNKIPIVMAAVGDPVGAGLVSALRRPGGNTTGFSLLATELSAKRLQAAKEAIPALRTIAFLWNPTNSSLALQLGEIKEAAQRVGIEIRAIEAVTEDDVLGAAQSAAALHADAMFVTSDGLQITLRSEIAQAAAKLKLPVIGEYRLIAEAGALLSIGPSLEDNYVKAAEYVDLILRGAKAAELPVQQPTKFEFVINLKAANALGLTLPPSMLALADEVIE